MTNFDILACLLSTDQLIITTNWRHLIVMANASRMEITKVWEEQLKDHGLLHYKNLGVMFFTEAINMNAPDFLQKMDDVPPSLFPISSPSQPNPIKRTKMDSPTAQPIIDLTNSPTQPIIDITNLPSPKPSPPAQPILIDLFAFTLYDTW